MLNTTNSSSDKIKNNVAFIIILAIVLLLPIFKGGNYPGAFPFFILAVSGIFLLSISCCSFERDKYWLYVWGSVSIAVLVHAFIYPLFLNNERFFIDGLIPRLADELNSRGFSKFRMLEVWSFFTAMWLFSWRVSLLNMKQLRVLLLVLFLASLFQAVFGLVHFISGYSSVLGLWQKEFYLNDATGTFVNRNHFAGMLAVSCPLVLTTLLMSKPLILVSFSKGLRFSIAAFYIIFVMLALISSHSRMGVVAAIFGLIVSFYFYSKDSEKTQYNLNKLKLSIVIFLFFLFFVWFGLGDILHRYTDLGDGNSRFDVWKSMFTNMSSSVWLFGIGPGLFEDVFQVIKPSNFSVRFIYAHNDYLEFIFEFGVLLSLFIVCVLCLWLKKLSVFFQNRNPLKFGLYGSAAAIGLHSLVDFNMQVPGSALFFYLSLGVFANPVVFQSESTLDKVEKRRNSKVRRSVLPRTKQEWLRFLRSD